MEKQIKTHNGNTIELEKLARVAHVRGRPVTRIVEVLAKMGEHGTFQLDYAIGVLDYKITRLSPAPSPDCARAGQDEKIIAMPQLFDVLCAMTIPGYERTVRPPVKKAAKAEVAPELKAGILEAVKFSSQNGSQASETAPSEAISPSPEETPIDIAERIASEVDAKQARRIVRPAARAAKKAAPKSKKKSK